jgi:hypothetical protein
MELPKDEPETQSASVSTLESPLELDESKSFLSFRTPNVPNVIKRNRSDPEIKATRPELKTSCMPPPPKSSTISPISSPCSPTQDEARRALELVLSYFDHQPAGLAAHEYLTMGKLMERLDLTRSQAGMMFSGLPRIDEHHDDGGPRLRKKRSIHNLG